MQLQQQHGWRRTAPNRSQKFRLVQNPESEPVRNASQTSPSEATPTRHYDSNIAQVKLRKAAMQTWTDVGDYKQYIFPLLFLEL